MDGAESRIRGVQSDVNSKSMQFVLGLHFSSPEDMKSFVTDVNLMCALALEGLEHRANPFSSERDSTTIKQLTDEVIKLRGVISVLRAHIPDIRSPDEVQKTWARLSSLPMPSLRCSTAPLGPQE